MAVHAKLMMSGAIVTALWAGTAMAQTGPSAGGGAGEDQVVRSDADQERDSGAPGQDIVVVGKSYGQEVGKTLTPLKDVPNTVSVVDREQIEAQNLFTLEDALTQVNGITVNGVGSEDPSYLSRGFTITNYLVDGVPTLQFGFPGVVPDLFAYDRLEVLRGPAGLFSGSGNPAGSINLVRKRPFAATTASARIGYGSYDNFRAEGDVSFRIADNFGVRAGGLYQDQDQFFDTAHRTRYGGFANGAIEIGERTTLTFGAYYDHFEPAVQTGLPGIRGGTDGSEGQLLNVRRSTYLGADWNRFESDTWSGFVELAHRVSDRWTLRATVNLDDVDRIDVYSYIGNQPVTATNGRTTQIAFQGDSFQKTRAVDVNAVGSFPLFGRDQTLILGTDYQARDFDSYFTRLNGFAFIDVYNPVSPAEPPLNPRGPLPYYPVQGTNATCPNTAIPQVPAPANCVLQVYGGTNTKVEQYGIYGQTRISPVAGLTLVGGGRLTWWEQETINLLTPATRSAAGVVTPASTGPFFPARTSVEAQFTPYAGIVWDVTDDLNIYGSYADSFTPQAPPAGRVSVTGDPIQPLIGDQYELGTKLALMGDRLLLSAAVYQLTQSNRLFNPPEDPTIFLQIGKVRARGIEADVIGEILPGWRVNGGYSYTKTRFLDNSRQEFDGLQLVPVVPEHMVKLFTNYAPVDGALAGASIGGGFTFFSETFGGNAAVRNAAGVVTTPSTIVRQDRYAVFDLRGGYKITPNIGLTVNVNNVFDTVYYARIAATGRGNFYGSPRTVFASLRFTLP